MYLRHVKFTHTRAAGRSKLAVIKISGAFAVWQSYAETRKHKLTLVQRAEKLAKRHNMRRYAIFP